MNANPKDWPARMSYPLVRSAAQRTWGEGFLKGRDEGYELGRKDASFELAILGFAIGFILGAILVAVTR